MKKKLLAMALSLTMVAGLLSGCGGGSESGNSTGGDVNIRLFSNLPDRNNGQGLVEQMIIDEYTEANPNVHIEVEALDEEAYKTKFKAYSYGRNAGCSEHLGTAIIFG